MCANYGSTRSKYQVAAVVCVASSVRSITTDVREFIKRRYIAKLLLGRCWKQIMSIPLPIISHRCSPGTMLPDLFIQPCCAMPTGICDIQCPLSFVVCPPHHSFCSSLFCILLSALTALLASRSAIRSSSEGIGGRSSTGVP